MNDPFLVPQPAALVLCAELIATWTLCSYGVAPDVRSGDAATVATTARWRLILATIVAAGATALLPPPGVGALARVGLSVLIASLTWIGVVGRRRLDLSASGKRWLAEWELALLATLVTCSVLAVQLVVLPTARTGGILQSGRFAAVLVTVSAICFAFRGGTHIVCGVLDKTNAAPLLRPAANGDADSRPRDLPELNRGRSIGNLERLLMLMVIGLGSYEALGFLMAAKGLIRAKEFEDRNFAEYFILGSLTSAAVALTLGLVLRVSVPVLWSMR